MMTMQEGRCFTGSCDECFEPITWDGDTQAHCDSKNDLLEFAKQCEYHVRMIDDEINFRCPGCWALNPSWEPLVAA